MRREGAPKERELLCGRLIDRPIRPLFPAGFYHEVQVWCYCLGLFIVFDGHSFVEIVLEMLSLNVFCLELVCR